MSVCRMAVAAWIVLSLAAGCDTTPSAKRGSDSSSAQAAPPGAGQEPQVIVMRNRALGEGTATLSWIPPAAKPTSSPDDPGAVSGYRVYVGTAPDALMLEAVIIGPKVASYRVEKLPTGIIYFSVTSFARSGAESAKVATVSKKIE
ncbi:MAG: fibronectin type III domain-containing protein [Steroidobacteraceae bacterium]